VGFRNAAEQQAARWYELHGYRVLATNVWVGRYELDLVALRRGTLVFVEVKSKGGESFGDPLEMVTPEKVRRVTRAAEGWLSARPELARCEVRFDVVAIRGTDVECVPNAFP